MTRPITGSINDPWRKEAGYIVQFPRKREAKISGWWLVAIDLAVGALAVRGGL